MLELLIKNGTAPVIPQERKKDYYDHAMQLYSTATTKVMLVRSGKAESTRLAQLSTKQHHEVKVASRLSPDESQRTWLAESPSERKPHTTHPTYQFQYR